MSAIYKVVHYLHSDGADLELGFTQAQLPVP